MPVPITAEQTAQLQAMVQAIVDDKATADAATAAATQAHVDLNTATSAAAAADIEETAADGKVNVDLQSLFSFLGQLTGTTISTTPTP